MFILVGHIRIQKVDRDVLRKYVFKRLGHGTIVVELDNEGIDLAIEDSVEKFQQYLTAPRVGILREQTGTVIITLEDSDIGLLDIRCMLPTSSRSYMNMSPYELLFRLFFPRFPVSEWYMLKTFYKSYQRMRGQDPDWYYDRQAKKAYVDCRAGPYDVFYVIDQRLTLKNIDLYDIAHIKDFKDYVLAQCKIMLAEIRGKFGGTIPVPGGSLSTNADRLDAQGQLVIAEIDQKLENLAKHANPALILG